MTALAEAVDAEFDSWGVDFGGCAVLDRTGILASAGDLASLLPWASVTKIASALAVLSVAADGLLDLDAPAGPEGSTVRHLLAHASGLAFDDDRVLSAPGRRRVYSNVGIDLAVAAATYAAAAPDAATLLADRVLVPLGMSRTELAGPPAHGMRGPVSDLALLAAELLEPCVLPPGIVAQARTDNYPGLGGVLPGFGRQDPNDWGLGLELRGAKSPHWMAAQASPASFGHFGQAGSFLWVDPDRGLAAVALTGTPFGPWASTAWPVSSARWMEIADGSGDGDA